jgi:protein tyrosine/serine phosphatase
VTLTIPERIEQVVADPRRHLPLPGTFNVRDVGGYPTRDGGTTRWRTLLRSDSLHRLTDASRGVLAQLGLRQVVDLRSEYERGRAPDALGRLAVTVTAKPVFSGAPLASGTDAGTGGGTGPGGGDLPGVYRYMVDHCGQNLVAAVTAVAAAAGTPAVVHCSAGKDRTGLVVALVLAAVGVEDEVIAADFALTGRYLRPDDPMVLRHLEEGTGNSHASDSALLACPPGLILEALGHLRNTHGSVAGYLGAHGAPPSLVDSLTQALTRPGPATI